MCGIIGVISKRNSINVLIEGLYFLEYRGYDSAGIAIIDNKNNLIRLRCLGKVKNLIKQIKLQKLYSLIGIAHTRWATHGKISKENTHPHISENIVIVHNGIIENYLILKNQMIKLGYYFKSETDSEILAHLINYEQKKNKHKNMIDIILCIVNKIKGSCSMLIMDSNNPNSLIAFKLGSPLIIGKGINEYFIASDQVALFKYTNNFIFLEDGDIAYITTNRIVIKNSITRKYISRKNHLFSLKKDIDPKKNIYKSYMQKEIYEQPKIIKQICQNNIKICINKNNNISDTKKFLKKIQYIKIIACGTSYYTGIVAKYWIEFLLNLPCDVEIASEFKYRKSVILNNTLLITLSQSGETADTLAALRLAKKLNFLLSLTICNVFTSSLVRESDYYILTKAGIEKSVASTKSFTSQLIVLLLFILKIGNSYGINQKIQKNIYKELLILPEQITYILKYKIQEIKLISKKIFHKKSILFLGRNFLYPIAMEAALKMKEISYIHAEGFSAGELKHGSLALIDHNIPIIILAPTNNLLIKVKSSIEEIYSRNGDIYIITDKFSEFCTLNTYNVLEIPYIYDILSPILYVIPLQLLAYYTGKYKGNDIDHPRNLAKSVTVE